METISLNYTSDFDGVNTDVHIDARETEGFYLGTLAKMFLNFVTAQGFNYVEDVLFLKYDGDLVSAIHD